MIPAEHAHLKIAAVSHPGMSGKNNEDRYGVSAYRLAGHPEKPSVLSVVADGIGGHRAGEVAAEIAVETISQTIAQSDTRQPVQTLQNAIIHASQVIHERAETDPALKGMGSTCACVWVIGDRLYTASVGDSRVYLIRGDTIQQLTTDHTWVQEAIENGMLDQNEARSHPNAHVIRRYLGSRNVVVPDTRLRLRRGEADLMAEANQGMRIEVGDCVILCSDGLTDLVDDSEILAYLRNEEPEAALGKLVELANQRGGHDNITIVSLQAPEGVGLVTAPAAAEPSPARRLPLGMTCLAAGALILVAVLVVGGLFLGLTRPGQTATPTAADLPLIQPTASLLPATGVPTVSPAGATPSPSPSGAATLTPFRPSPGAGTTPSSATLTPWPTNTTAP